MSCVLQLAFLVAFQSPDAADEFIARHRIRQESIHSGMVRSLWQDFNQGVAIRRDRQTIYFDAIGRRRLELRSEYPQANGNWAPHEDEPYETVRVYDGEVTASMTFDPRLDRVGNASTKETAAGYRAAQIFDGQKDINTERTPITFPNGIIAVLQSAKKNKIPIEVSRETQARVEMRFADDKEGEFWRFEVDKARDWVPVVIARVDAAGKTIMRTDFEYESTSSGFVYPQKGVLRYFGERTEQETPYHETRFDVAECQINDPAFDDSAFEIVLYPDTAVSDLRYGVNYRIGAENTYATQLAALATVAKTLNDKRVTTSEAKPMVSEGRAGYRAFVAINIAVLTAVLILFAGRRFIKSSQKQLP